MRFSNSWEDERPGAGHPGWSMLHLGMLALVLVACAFVALTRTGLDILLFLVAGLGLALVAHFVTDRIADSAGPGWALVVIAGLALAGVAISNRTSRAGDTSLRPVRKVLDWAAAYGYSGAIMKASSYHASAPPVSSHAGPAPGTHVRPAARTGSAHSSRAGVGVPRGSGPGAISSVGRTSPDDVRPDLSEPTTTSLHASAPRIREGETVSFVTEVRADGGTAPAGRVEFKVNGEVAARRSLRNQGTFASASFSTNNLPVGTHAVTARYTGTPRLAASESITLTISVVAASWAQ